MIVSVISAFIRTENFHLPPIGFTLSPPIVSSFVYFHASSHIDEFAVSIIQDLHSRKGLEGMIEQRKKLLKYLRRTDWDAYCILITRLGLRDKPNETR